MRQILSFRFIAAIGAIVGLLVLLVAARSSSQPTRDLASASKSGDTAIQRRIDLIDHVFGVESQAFAIAADGTATTDTRVILGDGYRALTIVAGTPGQIDCPNYLQVDQCAIVVDLIGEAVVWFALIPNPKEALPTVALPAIDELVDDRAVLVNGWEVPYAPVLNRRCPNNREWDSYRLFRADLGDHFTSLFDVYEQRLVAVVCDQTVPWVTTTTAPPTSTTLTPAPTPTTVAQG